MKLLQVLAALKSPPIYWLRPNTEPIRGAWIPATSLLRHEGGTFVYVKTSVDTFERRAVILIRSEGTGWLTRENLKAGDLIVVTGAQQVLSEELKGHGASEE